MRAPNQEQGKHAHKHPNKSQIKPPTQPSAEDTQKKSKVRPATDQTHGVSDEQSAQPSGKKRQTKETPTKPSPSKPNKAKDVSNQLVQLPAPAAQSDSKKGAKSQPTTQLSKPAENPTSDRPAGDTKKDKFKKPLLTPLPSTLPHCQPITAELLNTKISFTNTSTQASKSKDGKPSDNKRGKSEANNVVNNNDPSLEYYEKPFSAPVIKEAGAYFASLPTSSYLLDWSKPLPQDKVEHYQSEHQKCASTHANMKQQLYDYVSHFNQCEMCQKSSSVTKNNAYDLPYDPSKPQLHPRQNPSKDNLPKDSKSTSKDKGSKSSPKPGTESNYPFRVIMDTKDMWRTHGKFAIRPCSDHNFHLNLNKTEDNYYTPDGKDGRSESKSSTSNDAANYGKKNIKKGSAGLYKHVKPCACDGVHMGLFAEGTRCMIPHVDQSPSHHPLLNHALRLIREAINTSKVSAYSDVDGSGFLRYVSLAVPNTVENQLYQQWFTETSNGLHNDFKTRPQHAKPMTQTITYPQVQLTLIWSEGINDTIKKAKKLTDIEPVSTLPFPYAIDELKRPIFKSAIPQKKAPKKKGNHGDDDLLITPNFKPLNLISTNIPYAMERNESRKQLLNLIRTLVTQFKTVQRAFIEYANYHGYNVVTESLWGKDFGYAFQTDPENQQKIPAEVVESVKTAQYDNIFTPLSGIDLIKQAPAPRKGGPKVAANADIKPAAISMPSAMHDSDSSSSDSDSDSSDSDSSDDGAGSVKKQPSDKVSNVGKLPYNVPLCTSCHQTAPPTPEVKKQLAQCISAEFGINPKSLTMPILDPLNTIPTCVWGSIFVHYNNTWSHSNSVFSLHQNSWQHVLGKHSIDEHVMTAGIPLSAVDYAETYKIAPQVGIVSDLKGSSKNQSKKFTQDDDFVDSTAEKVVKDDKINTKPAKVKFTPSTTIALPKFSFSPSVFRQGNLSAFSHLLSHLLTLLPTNIKHIIEMHSGCGTISLHTLHHTQLLTASDVNANNKVTFQSATQQLSLANPDKIILHDKKVMPYLPFPSDELMKEDIVPGDVIIVDPPRKGLDHTTLQYLSLPFVSPLSLYPNKSGLNPVLGGKQGEPSLFPYDISDQLYVLRKKAGITEETDSGEKKTENSAESSSSLNKNSRDKKKWILHYQKIIDELEQQGKALFSNTKEHHLEQINKSSQNNDNYYGDLHDKRDYQREFAKNNKKELKIKEPVEPPIIDLPQTHGRVHWMQTARVLVYVSCGFPAFKHDCDILLKGPGKWRIAHTHAHLLFPGANHIETLTIFVRGVDL